MADGQFVNSKSETCWAVELPERHGFEYVYADRVSIEGGAAVFTNGDVFERELIAVYSQTGFASLAQCPWGGPRQQEEE